MNIGRKLAFRIISIVFLVGILSTYLSYQMELADETKRLESLGNMAGMIVEKSLGNSMMTRDFSILNKTLNDIGDTRSINNIRLINREGVVKAATDNKTVGMHLEYTAPECAGCHEKRLKGLYIKKEKIFRWAQPIENKPACHGCHNPSIKNNGVFIIDLPLADWEKEVRNEILMGSLIFILSMIIIGLMILALSKKLVINRLSRVIDIAGRFKAGDYNVHLPVSGDDEITRLEASFNEMAEAINTRDKEKDLLFERVSGSQKMWQETFDNIGDLISIHDGEFNIIKANRAFAEYFGLSPRETVNRKCYEFFHGDNLPAANCPHKITMDEKKPATAEITNVKTKRMFRISTFPFNYPDADFQGSIHIVRDITDEREKEMRLIMNDKLAALGQMASGIAHEINNPLASIAGCTEGLLKRLKKEQFEPGLFESYLKIIDEEIIRCKGITTAMLSFVRENVHEKKDIDLNEILDKTIEIIGFQGRFKEVEVIKTYKKEMPPIQGSESKLKQVLLVIITNALDAMGDRGILTIETDFERENEFIKITDSGPGIPAEIIDKIFDPFFTTKSERGGTGLGLSIARKIINNHNGNIDISSERGKGTTFRITLPLQ